MEIIVLGGPNGAGKSTSAARLLPPDVEFVNADVIAANLERLPGRNVDLEAGRILLERLDELARNGKDFAVETTLASRSLAPRIERLKARGYSFRLFYIWVPNAEMSIQRVAGRVQLGGHYVPDDVIRRRYRAGLKNFFNLYQPLADVWQAEDNSHRGKPELIASGTAEGDFVVYNTETWLRLQKEAFDEGDDRGTNEPFGNG